MPNSDVIFPAWSLVLLAACSIPAPPDESKVLPAISSCAIAEATMPRREVEALAALRRSVENGPLYTIPASASGGVVCSGGYESGVLALEYRFRNGGWLRVKRDARIEYTEQNARFTLSSLENPAAILAGAERAAFGADGCGIDWQNAEIQSADDDPGAMDTVFRGQVCNCQARIRRDAAGRVVGLVLRSAC